MSRRTTAPPRAPHGFTLVEVMVSLIVISVGLLGVVGMEGMALSSSANARMRSLAALEAAGLAATMHTNRDFWANTPGIVSIPSADTSDWTDGTGKLTQMADCLGTNDGTATCTASDALAAYDTQNWANSLYALLPNPAVTINCQNATPVSCTIAIVWVESSVGLSKQQRDAEATAAATVAGGGTPPGFENNTYTLYVQP